MIKSFAQLSKLSTEIDGVGGAGSGQKSTFVKKALEMVGPPPTATEDPLRVGCFWCKGTQLGMRNNGSITLFPLRKIYFTHLTILCRGLWRLQRHGAPEDEGALQVLPRLSPDRRPSVLLMKRLIRRYQGSYIYPALLPNLIDHTCSHLKGTNKHNARTRVLKMIVMRLNAYLYTLYTL